MRIRPVSIVLTAVLCLLASAPRAGAQCQMIFNVSVYNDAALSEDVTMVYGFSTTSDNSSLCTCGHGSYQTRTTVYAPDGTQSTVTSSGFTSYVAVPTNGRMGTYTVTGAASLFCSCAGLVGAGGVAAAIVARPAVGITFADACLNHIQTELNPPGVSGTFTLEYLTIQGVSRTMVGPVVQGAGIRPDFFNVDALQFGDQLRTLRARWTVNGVTGEGTRAYSIDVMDSPWKITCYNRPLESEAAPAPTVTACTTSVGTACSYTPRTFRQQFLDRVNVNGSGRDLQGVLISLEWFCTNPPGNCPLFDNWLYRRPSPGLTRCNSEPVPDVTVAHRDAGTPGFECGRRFLIVGHGCKTLADSGGQKTLQFEQLDLYRGEGESACNPWPNPNAKVLRIND